MENNMTGNVVITFDIAEKGKYLVVSDAVTWKGLCESATLYNGKKKKKVTAKTVEMNPGLNTVELDMDSDSIDSGLFAGTEITSCVIPEGVTRIGSGAFKNCRQLKKVVVPVSVKEAGGAFEGFDPGKVEFAAGRTELPNGVLNCQKNHTREITIPEGITALRTEERGDCFYSQSFRDLDIAGFHFPSSLKKVDGMAFRNTVLGHIEWPEDVPVTDQDISVTGGGFCKLNYMPLVDTPDTLVITSKFNCDTLIIPANVKEIKIDYAPKNLCHIYVDPANMVYDSRENCNAVIETATGRMILAGELTTVPEGVTEIAKTAEGITGAKILPVLPTSLKKIDCNISGFEEITLNNILLNAVDEIERFKGKLIIAPDVKVLPDCREEKNRWGDTKLIQFFKECNFTSIEFSEGLERIGEKYFMDNKIHGTITLPSTLKTIGSYAFQNCGVIYTDERLAQKSKEFATAIIPDSVTEIEPHAFADWIPANVKLPNTLEVLQDIFAPTKSRGSKHSTLEIPANVKQIKMESYGSSSFAQADTVIFRGMTAPEFTYTPFHLTDGTIMYPKGADYSKWKEEFKGWQFKEIE